MKRVLTALVLIPLVLLAVFKAPSWLFTLLVGAVALLALKEYLDLVEGYGFKPLRWLTYTMVTFEFMFLLWLNTGQQLSPTPSHFAAKIGISLAIAVLLSPFLFLSFAMRQQKIEGAFPAASMCWFGLVYVGTSMVCVAILQAPWFYIIFTFFAVWAGDIVAMYTGKAIGKHKMSPRVSPNKTWEGAVGSVVGSVLACGLLAYFAPAIDRATHADVINTFQRDHAAELRLGFVVPAAIVLNIAAQLGDLVESLIKRGANVKDSGTMLPGHGGILDRIDALLFAAPVALILFEFLR